VPGRIERSSTRRSRRDAAATAAAIGAESVSLAPKGARDRRTPSGAQRAVRASSSSNVAVSSASRTVSANAPEHSRSKAARYTARAANSAIELNIAHPRCGAHPATGGGHGVGFHASHAILLLRRIGPAALGDAHEVDPRAAPVEPRNAVRSREIRQAVADRRCELVDERCVAVLVTDLERKHEHNLARRVRHDELRPPRGRARAADLGAGRHAPAV
jgi:hypothetical protein